MPTLTNEQLMKIYTSEEILARDDLYDIQKDFCCFGESFKYVMTDGELGWLDFVRGRYSIADWINENLECVDDVKMIHVLTFSDPESLSQALEDDDCQNKAVCLDDDTALQKLFFWCSFHSK